MVEAGLREAEDVLRVQVGIGAAWDHLRHIVLADHLRDLLEMARPGQLLAEITGHRSRKRPGISAADAAASSQARSFCFPDSECVRRNVGSPWLDLAGRRREDSRVSGG